MEPIVHLLTVNSLEEAKHELAAVGSDQASHRIMAPKMQHVLIKIKDLDVRAANVLKQEMLAKGGEAAVAKWVSTFSQPTSDVILMGTIKQYGWLLKNLRIQPHGLKRLVEPIERILNGFSSPVVELDCGHHKITLGRRTLIMGILNVTPDSFSENGLFFDADAALKHARALVEDGADIIDIGGESTRPGADPVGAKEEMRRVVPVIEKLAGEIDVPISIDTSKAAVAAAAIEAGAAIVNDVTALAGKSDMAALCARAAVPVILMHMKGKPRTMQKNPVYRDLIAEIVGYLSDRAQVAQEAGIARNKILIDPGFGFGKSVGHNLEILKRLRELKGLGFPVVMGTSRKSTIGRVLGDLPTEERLHGTAATVAVSVLNGADIVRVHDVKEMAQVVRMTDAVTEGGSWSG